MPPYASGGIVAPVTPYYTQGTSATMFPVLVNNWTNHMIVANTAFNSAAQAIDATAVLVNGFWTVWTQTVYVNNVGDWIHPQPAKQDGARDKRARKLLARALDKGQRRELQRKGYFHVITRDGERVYRIKPGSSPTRIKGEDGKRFSYCIHAREAFAKDDVALALKLMLEADEEKFLETANATLIAA